MTTSNWAQYERTRNSRKGEGLAGGTEGIFNSNQFSDIDLADVMLHSEVNIPLDLVFNQEPDAGHRVEPAADEGFGVKYPNLYGRRYRRL